MRSYLRPPQQEKKRAGPGARPPLGSDTRWASADQPLLDQPHLLPVGQPARLFPAGTVQSNDRAPAAERLIENVLPVGDVTSIAQSVPAVLDAALRYGFGGLPAARLS